ncbi:toll/interleukin-1 receptor domain-containing protein [bacterium AH-315-J21]|nr:toll/interleukin-1 receptor domain-containing protein [bacterium AH-315-J21]
MAYLRDVAKKNKKSDVWEKITSDRIFLCHKSAEDVMVERLDRLLSELEYSTWFNEKDSLSDRSILKGMKESCAAEFFITPELVDSSFLAKEVDYAIAEKKKKNERFLIISLVFTTPKGETAKVPKLLQRYEVRKVESVIEAARELIHALRIRTGLPVWK